MCVNLCHCSLVSLSVMIVYSQCPFSHTQTSLNKPCGDISGILYTHLLDSYLNHYLPFAGTIPPPTSRPLTQGSPYYSFNTPPRLNSSLGSSIGYSPIYKGGVASELGGAGSNIFQVSSPYRQTLQHVPSETFVQVSQSIDFDYSHNSAITYPDGHLFLQILVEFWLNQNTYNGGKGKGDLLAQAQVLVSFVCVHVM